MTTKTTFHRQGIIDVLPRILLHVVREDTDSANLFLYNLRELNHVLAIESASINYTRPVMLAESLKSSDPHRRVMLHIVHNHPRDRSEKLVGVGLAEARAIENQLCLCPLLSFG